MLSANPLTGEIAFGPVNVEGFEQGGVILLDFYALAVLEGEMTEQIEQIGAAVLKSPTAMMTVFRVGLLDRHGEVEDRTAAKIIQALGPDAAAAIVLQSFSACFPEAAKAAGGPPKPLRVAAGTSSSATANGAKSARTRTGSGSKPRASSRKR
ncbi:MAG: hypothetical protein JWQ03_3116 [Variovorax sp.]|nr:hypothetical protein [Variovorax sp.]